MNNNNLMATSAKPRGGGQRKLKNTSQLRGKGSVSRTEELLEEQVLLSKERTVLSKERTILSYIRTAVAFIGVGIVLINIFNSYLELVILGMAMILLGFIEGLNGFNRLRIYKKKMERIKKEMGKDHI